MMAYGRAMRAIAAGALLVIGLGGPASAQGVFEFLFGNPRPAQPAPPPPLAPPPVVAPKAPTGPVAVTVPQSRAYCVRTCDGYYFAVGLSTNDVQVEQQRDMCSASCGDAPMKLYTAPVQAAPSARAAPAIERAQDETGAPYTSLPTAYGFRNAENPACACKSTTSGLPQIPISIDPTLRPGDIVVMADGVKVFRGTSRAPHEDADFTPVAGSRNLPAFVRQQMLSLQDHIAPQ